MLSITRLTRAFTANIDVTVIRIANKAVSAALSGEWEVPVTRNAKITPVNEGVGAGSGGLPSGITLWQGPPLPVTLIPRG
jgi:hypothetical protein